MGCYFENLPTDLGELCQVVQQNLLHTYWAERYGRTPTEAEQATVAVRSIYQKLVHLRGEGDHPLTVPRPLEKRQVGNCRDFTLFLTAILRYQGVPAWFRCGFGRYFLPNHYEDHWVCEVWTGSRWQLVDAQLDEFQRVTLGVSFDPLDVPAGSVHHCWWCAAPPPRRSQP